MLIRNAYPSGMRSRSRIRMMPRIRTGADAMAMNCFLGKSPSHDTEIEGKTNDSLSFLSENILMKNR